ncbi:MAG: hypothetical protein AB7F89_15245 [Pirellulaceae bacterium]
MSILELLVEFVFRLTFGVALAMGVTSSRWVTSGFYRVHLWVLMGLNTLASLSLATDGELLGGSQGRATTVLALAIALAVASYVGAVVWLYEQARLGYYFLFGIMTGGLVAGVLASSAWRLDAGWLVPAVAVLDVAASGLLLGITLTAMFLGHWYLNTPMMELSPLRRLVLCLMGAVLLRMACSALGLVWHLSASSSGDASFWIFLTLRWLAGLVAPLWLACLTWWTLKIPNTQSATGILYATVILTFIGELTAQFLSRQHPYPL